MIELMILDLVMSYLGGNLTYPTLDRLLGMYQRRYTESRNDLLLESIIAVREKMQLHDAGDAVPSLDKLIALYQQRVENAGGASNG